MKIKKSNKNGNDNEQMKITIKNSTKKQKYKKQ